MVSAKKIMKYSYCIDLLTSQFSSLNIFSAYANAIKVCDVVALYFMFALEFPIHILKALSSFLNTNKLSTRSRDNVRVGSRCFYLCDAGCGWMLAVNGGEYCWGDSLSVVGVFKV